MTRILRHSNWDTVLIGLSFAHLTLLWFAPSIPLIAIGVWWNSNTISHNFLHLPFFRSAAANRVYGLYLSLLLGIPQTLWKERHLAHHRGQACKFASPTILFELGLIGTLWALLLINAPFFFWTTYLPGYGLGLILCYLHGYLEHAGGTTSHYNAVYNFSFFNDGYHVEHHTRPGRHWTQLPQLRATTARTSRWPAVLRWIDALNLELMENIALRSRLLQRFLLASHERAFAKLLPALPPVRQVTIVGGGMFPRTALVLRRLLPDASIRILDENEAHLGIARRFLDGSIEFVRGCYIPRQRDPSDLVVIPLSFSGPREEVYRHPPSAAFFVHDWIWSKRGRSAIVSLLLLKRLNLIVQ